MQMHKQSTQFDPSQYISKKTLQISKRWRTKKAQPAPQYKWNAKIYRLGGGGDEEVVDKIMWL